MAEERKIGEGALAAAWRQGLKEVGQALKALPDSMPIVEEPGTLGNVTPQVVTQQMGYDYLAERQAELGVQAQNREKQPEMEM